MQILREIVSRGLWFLAACGVAVGGFILVTALLGSNGAPQEAAGAALGCGFAILPYVLARAFDEITRPSAPRSIT